MDIKRSLLLTFLFLFVSLLPFFAASPGEITVLIAEKVGEDSLHQSFIDIINDSIDLELKIEDFRSIHHTSSFLNEMYGIAASKGASYIIDSDLVLQSSSINFTLTAYRVADQMPVHQESGKHKIDLDLDQSVRVSASILVNAIKADSRINRDLLIQSDPDLKAEELDSEEIIHSEDPVELQEGMTVPQSRPFKKISISAGYAPFMTTGEASQYFTLGMAPEVHLAFRIKNPSGYWSIGFFGSWNMIDASGVLFDSQIDFIAAGPELRYGADINPFLDLYFSMGGGMSLFRMNRNEEGNKQTYVPYAAGGLGLNFNFTTFMGLYLSSSYCVYFEESLYITGFLPAIGIHIRV